MLEDLILLNVMAVVHPQPDEIRNVRSAGESGGLRLMDLKQNLFDNLKLDHIGENNAQGNSHMKIETPKLVKQEVNTYLLLLMVL